MKAISLPPFDWLCVTPEYADLYDRLDGQYARVYDVSAERLAEIADVAAGMAVADVGCGTGISIAPPLAIVGPAGVVIGIDVSAAMLARARQKFASVPNVRLLQGDAYHLAKVLRRDRLGAKVNVVISSFTYYYLHDRRRISSQTYRVLRPGGRWAYNYTPYLNMVEHDGRVYNQFAVVFRRTLDTVLRRRGHESGRGAAEGEYEANVLDREVATALRTGYDEVRVEPYALPLSPSQALRFTIEGFYRYGLRPSFSKTLCGMGLAERVAVLEEVFHEARAAMDDTGQRPTIFNIVATKSLN